MQSSTPVSTSMMTGTRFSDTRRGGGLRERLTYRTLAAMGHRHRWILRVDLTCQSVAVEDGLGDDSGCDAVADTVNGLDSLVRPCVRGRSQLQVERLVRETLRD